MEDKEIVSFDWKDFENAIEFISLKIKEKYGDKKFALLGLARGGLPILVAVSHQLGNKNIAVIQVKMSDDSDVYREENTANFVGEFLRDDIDDYIILEDIVVTGKSVEVATRHLQNAGKNVLGIYTMTEVKNFQNEYLDSHGIEVLSYVKNNREAWVEFPWEKKLI